MSRIAIVLLSVVLVVTGGLSTARASTFLTKSGFTTGLVRGGAELISCDDCAAEATDTDGDGRVDRVRVSVAPETGNVLTFAAGRGRAIEPGIYRGAWHYPPGDGPTLQVGVSTVCLGDAPGAFEVLRADFDTSVEPVAVRSFLVRFALRCSGEAWPFLGTLGVGDVDVPVIAWAGYTPGSGTLRVYGERIESAVSLTIDGTPVTFKRDARGGLKAKVRGLSPGSHELRVGGADGYVSPPFVVYSDVPPFSKTTFVARSDEGDMLGGGKRYRFSNPDVGLFTYFDAESRFRGFGLSVFGPSESFGLQVAAPESSPRLVVGSYPNASYSPSTDQAYMYASGVSPFSCQTLGQFTISDLAVADAGLVEYVRWLRLVYDVHCEGHEAGLHSTLEYVAPEPLRIIGARYSPESRTLRVRGTVLLPDADLYLDGQLLGSTRLDGDALVLENVSLRPGRHAVAVNTVSRTRYVYSQPWVFEVP